MSHHYFEAPCTAGVFTFCNSEKMHLLQSDTLEILYIKVFYLAETKSKVEILKFKGINSILT